MNDHNHARLGEHNGGDYDMRHQTRAPVMDPARVREAQAAAIARKDALLRMAMEAMLNLRKGAVAVWALGGSHETEQSIASIEAELSQSPAPVAVQPDMAQWPDQRNRGLLQAAKQALASLDRHAILPWGQPGYPAPTPGADLLYEARDYLRPAIEREQAWREVVPPLSASPEDKPK